MELNNNQTFTKFPNELLEHIMCSKLNASEIKILLCVVRYTYGFHREQHELSQSFIQKATDISKRHLQEMTKSLISKSILIETKKATPITPRWLAINPNFDFISKLNENQDESQKNQDLKNENLKKPNHNLNESITNSDTDAEFSVTPSAEFSVSGIVEFSSQERNLLKKDFKESSRVDISVNRGNIKPFNMNILKNQIAQQYISVFTEDNTYPFTFEEVVDIFVFYYEEYKKHMNTDHPILNNKNVKKVIEELPLCDDTSGNGYIELFPDFYPDMIKKHFETSYQNCDYNILHFISGSIRALRYYETIYE